MQEHGGRGPPQGLHHLPSGYATLDAARRKHGERADKYVELLRRADPLADAVVEAFTRLPEEEWRRMLDLALSKGIDSAPAAPEALKALFARLDYVPFWVDRAQ